MNMVVFSPDRTYMQLVTNKIAAAVRMFQPLNWLKDVQDHIPNTKRAKHKRQGSLMVEVRHGKTVMKIAWFKTYLQH